MRWKFVYCILLASFISVSLANERPKRDLYKLKKFIASKLLKRKVTIQPNYKLFRIPGFDNILIQAIPKETQKGVSIPVKYLGDKTANETLKALEDIKKLLKLGILNDKNDKFIEEQLFPIFQTPSIKFTTAEVTKTYSVKPIYPPEPIIVRNPPIKVTEVISLVPDDIKYSYKQTTNDKETTTFVSQNSPDTVITTTKHVPRLPPFLKTRIQEVASMGFNPYAFATPGAVIPARPPILVEEIVRVPTVPQGVNYLREPEDVGTYGSPVFSRAVKPPVLVKENSYFPAPPPEVVDVFHQPVAGVVRPPVFLKETMKVPAYPPGIPPLMIEPRPPVLVKETVKIPGIKSYVPEIDTRGTVNVKVNSGPRTIYYNDQLFNGVNNNRTKKLAIPPPPSLTEDQNISKNTSGLLYSLTDKNGMNNSGQNINPTRTKISRSTSNVENRTEQGTEKGMEDIIEIPPPPTLGDFNKSKGFSYNFVSRNKTYNRFNFNIAKSIENEAHANNKHKNVNNSTSRLPSFIAAENLMKLESIGAESTNAADKFSPQKPRHEMKIKNTIKPNKTISIERQHKKRIAIHNQHNISSSSSRNISNNQLNTTFMNNNKNSESVAHRGDIPSLPLLSSQENEDNFEESEINNNANIFIFNSTTSKSSSTEATTTSKTHLGKIDDTLDGSSSDLIPLPPNLNNKNKSRRGHSKYVQNNTNTHNLTILQFKPKENASVIPPLPPVSDNLYVIPQKDISHTVNITNSSFMETVDNTSSSEKYSSNRTKVQNNLITHNYNNKTENVLPSPPTFSSNKINSILNQKINSLLKSTTLSSNTSFTNKTVINDVNQMNLSVVTSNTTEENDRKSELVSDKEVNHKLNALRKNNNPTKAFIQAQADLNQIEDKITSTSDTKNTSMKSNDIVSLSKKRKSTVNSNNTLVGPKINFSTSNALNEKYKSNITNVSKINSIFTQNKTRNSNITVKSRLNNHRKIGGITIGNRRKPQMSLSMKKGNNRNAEDKYALNPSRKAAINRLLGRNETKSNNLNSAVTKAAISRFSQKNSKTSSNNRTVVNMNRKITIGKRSKRDVNKVPNKIPNHYLYMPPVGVYVPPPIRSTGLDKVYKNRDRTDEALRTFKKNYINANLVRNPLIIMNSNSHVFQQDNFKNSSR